jgi:hypothetical protein
MNPKTITSLLVIAVGVLVLLAAPTAVQAQFDYMDNGNGTCTIVNPEGHIFVGAVAIPATINGLTVTAFSTEVFEADEVLTSVTIPDSVSSIPDQAFESCVSLSSVAMGCGIRSIGNYSFAGCNNLSSVTIPGRVTSIGVEGFYYCGLTNIYFKGNAPAFGNDAFAGNPATVYYLPGTAGWAQFFSQVGLSGALWFLPNPLILSRGPDFGVHTNQFGFIISWATNTSVLVEGCTNLANPVWTPLQTNTLTNGWFYFSDSQWTNYSGRYYRIGSA